MAVKCLLMLGDSSIQLHELGVSGFPVVMTLALEKRVWKEPFLQSPQIKTLPTRS